MRSSCSSGSGGALCPASDCAVSVGLFVRRADSGRRCGRAGGGLRCRRFGEASTGAGLTSRPAASRTRSRSASRASPEAPSSSLSTSESVSVSGSLAGSGSCGRLLLAKSPFGGDGAGFVGESVSRHDVQRTEEVYIATWKGIKEKRKTGKVSANAPCSRKERCRVKEGTQRHLVRTRFPRFGPFASPPSGARFRGKIY